jgi:hypothetical protein
MKQLAWCGIAYALYLGVENWKRLERLEDVLDDVINAVELLCDDVEPLTRMGRHVR